jgi:hypothetical protein
MLVFLYTKVLQHVLYTMMGYEKNAEFFPEVGSSHKMHQNKLYSSNFSFCGPPGAVDAWTGPKKQPFQHGRGETRCCTALSMSQMHPHLCISVQARVSNSVQHEFVNLWLSRGPGRLNATKKQPFQHGRGETKCCTALLRRQMHPHLCSSVQATSKNNVQHKFANLWLSRGPRCLNATKKQPFQHGRGETKCCIALLRRQMHPHLCSSVQATSTNSVQHKFVNLWLSRGSGRLNAAKKQPFQQSRGETRCCTTLLKGQMHPYLCSSV